MISVFCSFVNAKVNSPPFFNNENLYLFNLPGKDSPLILAGYTPAVKISVISESPHLGRKLSLLAPAVFGEEIFDSFYMIRMASYSFTSMV
jgi:hypothetical protein